MAKREIVTTIAVGGEKEFAKALAGARRELKLLDERLKLSAEEFDEAGDAQAKAKEQARLLSAKLNQQEEIVRALRGALNDAKVAWGEGSKQADDYAIQLSRARVNVAKIKKDLDKAEHALDDVSDELEDAADEMDDAGDEAKQLGKRLEDDLADGAEAAESDLERLQKTLDDLRSMGAIKIGIELAEKAWEAAQALVDFVNEQRDVVRQRSIVDYQAIAAGYDPEMIQAMIMRAASITGDYEGAQSGFGMMTNVPGMSEQWLRAWSDMLLGADLKFQELEFSGLMEGLQETLSNRVLAGPFMDLLVRSGYNEAQIDAINERLRAAETLEKAMEEVMTPLANVKAVQREDGTYGSYADFLRMYIAGESDLIAGEKAELELAQAMADLGETLQPIATWLTEVATGFVTAFNTFLVWFGELLGKDGAEKQGEAAEEAVAAAVDTSIAIASKSPLFGGFGNAIGAVAETLKLPFDGQDYTSADFWGYEAVEKSIGDRFADFLFDEKPSGGGGSFGPAVMPRPSDDFIGPMPLMEDVKNEMDDAASDAATSGSNVSTNFANGISAGAPEAAAQAQAMVDSINGIFGTVQYPMFGGMSASAAGRYGGMPNISINLDGRRVGQLITPHVSRQQGRMSNG